MTTPATTQSQVRRGFGLKAQVKPTIDATYKSDLIERMKARGYTLRAGRLTLRLAKEFGFCYGVDRAVDYAYETRTQFPNSRIFLTNEIIHNPRVNENLRRMGVGFLNGRHPGDISFDELAPDDVVIIPAFGNSTEELARLQTKSCVLVDTTCGSVVSVWKRVEKYAAMGFTSIIHGKAHHEETRATSSRAYQGGRGKYLVVFDKGEAQRVCDYIEGRGNREAFLKTFAQVASPEFDPDRDLERVGCANQTTMLSSESLEIAGMLRDAMASRYGAERLEEHFCSYDTICSATQERQDAMLALAREQIDLFIVIGGFNSSNTAHLCEIGSKVAPTYHVQSAEDILSAEAIRHKPLGGTPAAARGWLPGGERVLGITAGASTPDRVVEEVVRRILDVAGVPVPEEA